MSRPWFQTDGNVHVPSVTAAEMRRVDQVATEKTGPQLLQVMEQAGRSLAELALELLEINGIDAAGAQVVVLSGGGGNGGGGICAARHLATRVGMSRSSSRTPTG